MGGWVVKKKCHFMYVVECKMSLFLKINNASYIGRYYLYNINMIIIGQYNL